MKRISGVPFLMAIPLAMTLVSSAARGQCEAAGGGGSCGLPGAMSMTAGRVVFLQVSATSTALTAPTPADFDAGFNSTAGPTLTIRANASWALNLRSSAAQWTATNTSPAAPARTNKPASDLLWSTNSGGPFVGLTTSDVNLVSGLATGGSATTLHFETLYSWILDTPGDYGLTLILTLTSP